jgi:hypothetical protein
VYIFGSELENTSAVEFILERTKNNMVFYFDREWEED